MIRLLSRTEGPNRKCVGDPIDPEYLRVAKEIHTDTAKGAPPEGLTVPKTDAHLLDTGRHAAPAFGGDLYSFSLLGRGVVPYDFWLDADHRLVACISGGLGRGYLPEELMIPAVDENGPVAIGSAEPFRGRKARLDEGGIRMPAIVAWPGKVPTGNRSNQPTMTMDLFPTFAALSGATLPQGREFDGIDLSDILFNEEREEREPRMLFWESPRGVHVSSFEHRIWAVRHGKWKLRQDHQRVLELFDLEADPQENRGTTRRLSSGWKKVFGNGGRASMPTRLTMRLRLLSNFMRRA